MSILDPAATTPNDIILVALDLAGVIGVGQTPGADDINNGWALLQMMLQEWTRKRWLIYALTTVSKVSTGAQAYSLGPGGDFDTGVGASFRPDKIESAFVRQLNVAAASQVDYPLQIVQSKEDYNKIRLKQLSTLPGVIFYDPQWPLGQVYAWPVPTTTVYGLYVTVKISLPYKFANLATVFNIPYEYYNAIVMQLALRFRTRYGIPSFPGDTLPGQAKDALNALRGGNTAIKALGMPSSLSRGGGYNIFSDQNG